MDGIDAKTGKPVTVLACDVGGTNTSVALLEVRDRSLTITRRYRFSSRELSSLEDALETVMDSLKDDRQATLPQAVCVSGAGPIRENRCYLTNLPWIIDGDVLATVLSLPVRIINDFTAISYGIPLLDTGDAEKIVALKHPDGTVPPPSGLVRAVVGAGTGLGVGYVVDHHEEFVALPSEAGHVPFAPYDDLSRELFDYVVQDAVEPPDAECFVSGPGIANTLAFFRNTGRVPKSSPLYGDSSPETGDPARAVSEHAAAGDPAAQTIMELFVENYARAASAAALHFLPLSGLYLAGGIVTKNEAWFSRDDRFMKGFLRNYREGIEKLLRRIPVYIVRDYEVSLYGAAYGALRHLMD